MGDGGKGSTQRPFDHKKFSDNFEKIFGKKPEKRLADMTEAEFDEAMRTNFEEKDVQNNT